MRIDFNSIWPENLVTAIRRAMLIAMVLSLTMPAVAAINTGTDAEAELPYWEVVEHGVSIRLVQRLPDQTRGFFQARGQFFTTPVHWS